MAITGTQRDLIRAIMGEMRSQPGDRRHLEQQLELLDEEALRALMNAVRGMAQEINGERAKRKRGQFWG